MYLNYWDRIPPSYQFFQKYTLKSFIIQLLSINFQSYKNFIHIMKNFFKMITWIFLLVGGNPSKVRISEATSTCSKVTIHKPILLAGIIKVSKFFSKKDLPLIHKKCSSPTNLSQKQGLNFNHKPNKSFFFWIFEHFLLIKLIVVRHW